MSLVSSDKMGSHAQDHLGFKSHGDSNYILELLGPGKEAGPVLGDHKF